MVGRYRFMGQRTAVRAMDCKVRPQMDNMPSLNSIEIKLNHQS